MRTLPIACLVLATAAVPPARAQDLGQQAVRILKANCLTCHGQALQSSKLDLRTRQSMLTGGERGPSINPGHPEVSRLYRFATGMDQPSMPPGRKLAQADLDILRDWIKAGAPMADPSPADTPDKAATLAKLEDRPITPEERKWWAFQPVKRPTPPAPGNPIDAFVNQQLTAKGLKPSPAADRRALIRRIYLDVTGLPPTPSDIQAFLDDREPNSWEKLVDRLLASPQYGERWARHWLDLVRYADSGGYEFDRDRPTAYLFRDWVVRALNADMPYDEFVRLQLAGDEWKPGDPDSTIATTYLRLGPEANIKTVQTRMDELDDIIATTSGTMLGMTTGCARCHNHKFDPIPQKDYYRLQAVFFNAKPAEIPVASSEEIARQKQALAAWQARIEPVQNERKALEAPYRKKLIEEKRAKLAPYIQTALATPPAQRTEGQRLNVIQVEQTLNIDDDEVRATMPPADLARVRALSQTIKALEDEKPQILSALSIKEPGRIPEPSHFLHHGSVDSPGSLMAPGVLSAAYEGEWNFPAPPPGAASSHRRRAFSEWVTSPANPLTARVMVKRVWQHHFGEGIVRTPSNFGKTGEAPTHPQLLDWLAAEFVENGWKLKPLHRLILTSAAYRMSSADNAKGLAADPENRLLWRQARQRLEAEALRDSMLAVAGNLDLTMGGRGVYPYIDPSLWSGSSGRTWPGKSVDDATTFRRSIYIFQKRTIPVPMMELFDAPNAIGACSRRNRSTVATQALLMMNNAFVLDQSRRFAERLQRDAGTDTKNQVDLAYRLALARTPSPNERDAALSFLRQGNDRLSDFAHAILNLNEFVYVP